MLLALVGENGLKFLGIGPVGLPSMVSTAELPEPGTPGWDGPEPPPQAAVPSASAHTATAPRALLVSFTVVDSSVFLCAFISWLTRWQAGPATPAARPAAAGVR